MELPERQCSRCKETFPATPSYFHRKPRGKYGLQSVCKPCALEVARQASQELASKEARRVRERSEQYRERSRERSRRQKRNRKCTAPQPPTPPREKKPKPVKPPRKKLTLAEKEAARRAWLQSEQGKRCKAMINHRRLARLRGLPATMTAGDWNAALSYFEGKCAVCGKEPDAHQIIAADHWIPLKADDCPGTIPSNVVPLCHGKNGCNNKKGTLKPEAFLDKHYADAEKQFILARINGYFGTLL